MKKHEAEQMNEEELASQVAAEMEAEKPVAVKMGPKKGLPLPEDFVNPPQGQLGHHCLDQFGRYQPEWMQLKLHKVHDNMPQRQYFNACGKEWLVEVGRWVDVPPQIITILSYTDQEVISMDIKGANLIVDRGVPKVVDLVPRFSYTSLPSA